MVPLPIAARRGGERASASPPQQWGGGSPRSGETEGAAPAARADVSLRPPQDTPRPLRVPGDEPAPPAASLTPGAARESRTEKRDSGDIPSRPFAPRTVYSRPSTPAPPRVAGPRATAPDAPPCDTVESPSGRVFDRVKPRRRRREFRAGAGPTDPRPGAAIFLSPKWRQSTLSTPPGLPCPPAGRRAATETATPPPNPAIMAAAQPEDRPCPPTPPKPPVSPS